MCNDVFFWLFLAFAVITLAEALYIISLRKSINKDKDEDLASHDDRDDAPEE